MKKAVAWKPLLLDAALFLLGGVSFAIAITMFTAPNDLAPGGVTGVATMLNYLSREYLPFELPIGAVSIVMNVPLLILAWVGLGRRMAIRTVVATLLSNTLIDLLEPVLPPFEGDIMLASIFGGVLMGIGVGLFLHRGGSTGGTEIVARLLEKKYPHIPIGKLMLVVDGTVIALSAAVYRQLESPMYAVVLVFIASQITDWLVYGGRRGKMAMILSKKHKEMTEAITARLDMGATLLPATGGYTGQAQEMILCAVRREEVFRLKRLVYELDPDAFFMLLSTDEVLGLGWQDPKKV
ncbi:MAG: YitT family protein [Clostridia bacterium]|nr:YitT family protein [Clostridia bacterium]